MECYLATGRETDAATGTSPGVDEAACAAWPLSMRCAVQKMSGVREVGTGASKHGASSAVVKCTEVDCDDAQLCRCTENHLALQMSDMDSQLMLSQ